MYIYKPFWGVPLGSFEDWFGFSTATSRNSSGINVLFWKRHFHIIHVILSLWITGEVIYHLKVIKTMGRTRRKRNAFRKHIYKLAKVCGWVLIVCFIVEFIQIARAEVLNHRRLNESSIRGFQNFCTSWAVVVFNTAWTSIAQCYDNSTSRTVNPLCWPILSGRYIFIHTSSKISL